MKEYLLYEHTKQDSITGGAYLQGDEDGGFGDEGGLWVGVHPEVVLQLLHLAAVAQEPLEALVALDDEGVQYHEVPRLLPKLQPNMTLTNLWTKFLHRLLTIFKVVGEIFF